MTLISTRRNDTVKVVSHNLLVWFARRILSGVAVVWAAATFTFLVQCLMPGDRAQIVINVRSGDVGPAPAAELATINAKYGFDQPLAVQYGKYILRILHGDLGESYQQHRPVAAIIAEQIGPTIVLAIAALLMAWVIAILTTLLIAGRDNIWSKLLKRRANLLGNRAALLASYNYARRVRGKLAHFSSCRRKLADGTRSPDICSGSRTVRLFRTSRSERVHARARAALRYVRADPRYE
ncbi:ABC transporter permease [Bradyrhizobium sp. IC3195]|uniref:ABC transporter permease n=1 Tax=Bradyrhizobium sp. IC3195 TaxID=2793804 RepID=UPI001CD2AF02|nr:ABC transporter permease [Bradyrhizobium sp. IC3195]